MGKHMTNTVRVRKATSMRRPCGKTRNSLLYVLKVRSSGTYRWRHMSIDAGSRWRRGRTGIRITISRNTEVVSSAKKLSHCYAPRLKLQVSVAMNDRRLMCKQPCGNSLMRLRIPLMRFARQLSDTKNYVLKI